MSAIQASEGPARQHAGLGIALRVAAMALFAVMSAIIKWCGAHGVPVFQMIFFRNAFAFIPLGLYIWRTTGPRVLITRRPVGHLARASIGLIGMTCSFTAVQYLPLTAATALNFAAPLFMTALAAPILNERVGVHRWGAVAIGFLGVLIMVRPDPGRMNLVGAAFALGGAVASAGAMVTIREIGKTEKGATIVFYFTLGGAAVGLASLPFGWVMPGPNILALLVVMGLVGGLGQLLMTEALRVAPVGVVAPFDYIQLLWASLIGFSVWGEVPQAATLAGAVVVAGSGGYILWREIRAARQPQTSSS